MSIKSTNWVDTNTNPTNFAGDRTNETQTVGSPFGLLLSLTQAESVDAPANDFSTNYTNTTTSPTNWTQT